MNPHVKPAMLLGYRLLLFTDSHVHHPQMETVMALGSRFGLPFSFHMISLTAPSPAPKAVLQQCKHTRWVQENQPSKSCLCSPGWSTLMLISPPLTQLGRRPVTSCGSVLALGALQQSAARKHCRAAPTLLPRGHCWQHGVFVTPSSGGKGHEYAVTRGLS